MFGEADSLPAGEDNPAASAMGSMLVGNVMRYFVVEPKLYGKSYHAREIVLPGPPVLHTTSTKLLRHPLMTRLFRWRLGQTTTK